MLKVQLLTTTYCSSLFMLPYMLYMLTPSHFVKKINACMFHELVMRNMIQIILQDCTNRFKFDFYT